MSAPSSASLRAQAAPIPRAPPVTNATLSATLPFIVIGLRTGMLAAFRLDIVEGVILIRFNDFRRVLVIDLAFVIDPVDINAELPIALAVALLHVACLGLA